MELMPAPDFFESIDFNFLTTEFFHTHEHEFDYTLTDGENMHLEWHGSDHEDAADDDVFGEKVEDEKLQTLDEEQQTCDDASKEAAQPKEDEPKVEEQ